MQNGLNALKASIPGTEFLNVFVNTIFVLITASPKYRVIRNDCRGFGKLSYTIHLR
jgi:hypothetical protein